MAVGPLEELCLWGRERKGEREEEREREGEKEREKEEEGGRERAPAAVMITKNYRPLLSRHKQEKKRYSDLIDKRLKK